MSNVTKESFLEDVKTHEMHILKDDGVYRHIVFKRPECSFYFFEIVTWPGYLSFVGDMGSFTFWRLNDMFEFFRHDRINLGYWAEKLVAIDRTDGFESWNVETFKSEIKRYFDDQFEDASEKDKKLIWEKVEDEVLSNTDNPFEAYNAALSFEWNNHRPFQDFWEVDTKEYTSRFIWCCYALVYTVQKYDQSKTKNA